MNLWVRSQKKAYLINISNLIIEEYNGYYGIETKTGESIFELGTYKTKERAIEVLDEIQNILKPKYILDTSSIKPNGDFYEENEMIFQDYTANAKIEELSTFVYQMPEN